MPATPPVQEDVAGLFGALDAAGRTPDIVVYNASGRARGAFVDLVPADVEAGDRGLAPSAASWWRSRRHSACCPTSTARSCSPALPPASRAIAQSATVRDGQVRAARSGPEHGARTVAAGHPCRAFRHRRRHPQRGPARSRPTSRIGCSIPTRSRESYWNVLQQPRSAWSWELGAAAVGGEVLSAQAAATISGSTSQSATKVWTTIAVVGTTQPLRAATRAF